MQPPDDSRFDERQPMVALVIGLLLVAGWAVVFFAVQPATGLIHLALVVGVALIIRGIAVSKWGSPGAR